MRELEAALKPFAEAGAALDPRTDAAGTAVSVQDRDGKKHVVTYGRLRQAARVLGEGLRKVENRAEIVNRHQLVDDKVLWQIRWMAAYADKPRWLLLRETLMADGRRKLEALSYSGEVRATRAFQPSENDGDMKASLSRIYAVPALQDAGRLEAIGFLAKAGDMKTGRGLDDAYRNQVSDDSRERCHRRRWSVVSDVHINVGGMPGDRLMLAEAQGLGESALDILKLFQAQRVFLALVERQHQMIGLVSGFGLLRPRRLDLDQGGVEIGQCGAGVAIDDPELVELFALFLGGGDIAAQGGVIVAGFRLAVDALGDHRAALG